MLYNDFESKWETEECKTISESGKDGSVTCSCNTVKGDFVSIFTDTNRVLDMVPEIAVSSGQETYSSTVSMACYLLPIFIILVAASFYGLKQDKRDLQVS